MTKPEKKKKRCLFQQFMSSVPKIIKMHRCHTFSAVKSSTIPLFLCQECSFLCVYSVTLLLLPLHDNSFPNFLSSPLVAILSYLQNSSLSEVIFLQETLEPHTPLPLPPSHPPASSLTAFPCYSAITQEKLSY